MLILIKLLMSVELPPVILTPKIPALILAAKLYKYKILFLLIVNVDPATPLIPYTSDANAAVLEALMFLIVLEVIVIVGLDSI